MGRLTTAARDSFQKATSRQPVPDWFGRFSIIIGVVFVLLVVGQLLFGGSSDPSPRAVRPSTSVPAQELPGGSTTTPTTATVPGGRPEPTVPQGTDDGPSHDAVTADGSRTSIPGGAYDALLAAVQAGAPRAQLNRITVTEQSADQISTVVTVDPDGLSGATQPSLSWFTLTRAATGWTATPGS